MDLQEIKQRIRGPIAYPTTPFKQSGEPDPDAYRKQIRFLIDGGIRIVVPCGGTGEFFSLSLPEWQTMIEVAMEESGGEDVMVVPSIGGSIGQAISMAGLAEQLGCQMVQLTLLDPMFGTTEEGVYGYNRQIADAISIGVMLYRTPSFPLSIAFAERMCKEFGNVIAFKDETNDVQWFSDFVLEMADSVVPVCGGGETVAAYYLLSGAKAFTTGIANLLPELSLAFYRAALEKRWDSMMALRARLRRLSELRSRPGRMIPVIKEGLKLMGVTDQVYSRPPVAPLSESERCELQSILCDLSSNRENSR